MLEYVKSAMPLSKVSLFSISVALKPEAVEITIVRLSHWAFCDSSPSIAITDAMMNVNATSLDGAAMDTMTKLAEY